MKIDETIFRRYDIRGIYPKEFGQKDAYKIGLAFANLYPDLKKILVGGDTRKATPELKEAVKRGLIDGGKKVIDAGITITPVLFFAVCHYNFDGGIVVTASHLGGEYNGIKIVFKNAHPTEPDDYEKIKEAIVNDQLIKAPILGKEEKSIDAENDYINYLLRKIKLKKSLKIIIDSGNGAARYLPEKIFKKLGCEAETIYGEADDSYPNHTADPYHEENMQDLKRKVIERKADLGIAYDGDGDRMGIIDNKGNIIDGNDQLMMFSKDALSVKKGPIVVDARASLALIEEVQKAGQQIYLTVGYHSAVLEKIIEKGGVFGGETTSHFYFPLDYYLIDDGVFASLKATKIASETEDFSGYIKSLPRYFASKEIFISFPDEKKYIAVDDFVKLVKKKKLDVNDVDGARINFENGWGIIRPSNTSPFIKIKFEGKTKKDLVEVTKKSVSLMSEAGIELSKENKKDLKLER